MHFETANQMLLKWQNCALQKNIYIVVKGKNDRYQYLSFVESLD